MGAVNHLVNTVSLGHDFSFEEAGDTTAFPHLMVCASHACDAVDRRGPACTRIHNAANATHE
jgi:hypothetical protein